MGNHRHLGWGLSLAMAGTAAFADGHENVIVSHGFSYFGELKYGPDDSFAYVNLDAPKGGELSISTTVTFDSFNQFSRQGVSETTGTNLMYEDLMVSAADDPYGTYCYLCTTIEYPESLDWVVLNLREDVTFADGTPMTAEDVKFTVDLFLEQAIPEFRAVVGGYFKSIEQTGPYQMRFEFTDAAPKRDRVGLIGIWNPFSKTWFEKTGARLDEAQSVPFMGTGPYIAGNIDMGRTVTYVRNPNWWGADHPLSQGRHNFDSIRVEVFLDQTAAFEAFKTGIFSFRTPASSKEWATSYNFPAVEAGHVVLDAPKDTNITGGSGFVFNLRRERWQDPRVREAITKMFNFEWSNDSLFFGLFERHNSFWQNSDLEAAGVPEGAELAALEPLVAEGLLDASILTDAVAMPPVNQADTNLPDRRTRRAALRLLSEAGWEQGDDGMLRNDNGDTLELTITHFSGEFDRIINPFVENLRSIGVDAVYRRIDVSTYVELRRSREWDLNAISAGQGFQPSSGLKQWFGSETREDSSRNIMGLADPAVDRLIDAVIAAETLDDLRANTKALDRVLRAHGFWLPRWGSDEHWFAYWDIYGRPETLPQQAVGLTDFWWFEQEKYDQLRAKGAL